LRGELPALSRFESHRLESLRSYDRK
jgi:hypothetical protein